MADGLHIVNTVDNSQVDNAFAKMRKGIVDSAKTAEQQGKKIDSSFERAALSIKASSETIKKKIYEESQTIHALTNKIIAQKDVVKDLQFDVKRIGDAYKKASKNGSIAASSLLAEYNAAKKALEEEKAALFALNQEKAKASVRVQELRGQLELTKKTVEDTAITTDMLAKSFAALGGAAMVKEFLSNIVHVRGEFQQLEVAFKTMLGSEEKAAMLMQQLTQTAAVTPFDLKGVTDGAKQLLAYGVAAEDVNDTLIHLGDIAAGLSLPLGDLVYLYGTTITQGRMFTQDLRQFMGRGIPLAEELAKQFGVTKDKVGELVTAGKVGAEEFKAAIMAMSSEGGKFAGLMEAQSKTISGQISNLEDAIDNMFNELGKKSEGIINSAIEGVSFLVEHYEEIGQILKTIIWLYGSYKAAVISVWAVEKAIAAGRSVKYFLLLTQRINMATAAQRAFNITAMKNPYILLAAGIAAVTLALYKMATAESEVEKMQRQFNATMEGMNKKYDEAKQRIETLISVAEDEAEATVKRDEAIQTLIATYPNIIQKYIDEEGHLKNIIKLKKELADLEARKQEQSVENLYNSKKQQLENLRSYIASATKVHQEDLDRLAELEREVEELGKKVANNQVNRRMSEYRELSTEELKNKIEEMRLNVARGFGDMWTEWVDSADGSLSTPINHMLSTEETERLIEAMQSELDRRINSKKDSSSGWAKEAKEKYDKALKEYNDFINNKSNTLSKEEFNKRAQELKEAVNAAKQEYDKYKPQGSNNPKKDPRVEAEKEINSELEKLRQANKKAEIDGEQDATERRRKQIAYDYETRKKELDLQEQKWRALQKGHLTQEQEAELLEGHRLNAQKRDNSLQAISDEEVQKSKEKYNKLIEQYQTFDQKRRSIEEKYQADMAVLQQHLDETEDAGEDISDIQATMQARTEAYKKEFQTLQSEILNSNDFFNKLFSDQSERGYKVLRDFYKQAEEVFNNAKIKADGVEISLPFKQEDGTYVKKQVNITLEEFERMKKQVKNIQKELEKQNPFAAFAKSWKDLIKSMKEDGDVTGALKKFKDKGKEVTGTIRSWGDSLGAVFGDRFSKSMNEIMDFCDGAMDLGTGIAQIWSGDIVGGITSALSGISQIVSLFTSWKEKMEEMKRQWYIAEIETNRALDERANKYAAEVSAISDIIKGTETLNWLIQQGYAKPNQVAQWQAYYAQQQQLIESVEKERQRNNELWNNLQNQQGHYEWGNSLNGGSATWDLRGASAPEIELLYNQNKLTDAARQYYEAWVASGKSVKELLQQLEECYQTMREMVMGVSFDGFLENSKEVLKKMRSDVSALADFTEETMQEALINAFMYQHLAEALQPLYNELSENLIKGTANSDYLQNWKERYISTMKGANEQLDLLSKEMGIDLSDAYKQEASSKGFNAMSQETGEELNGRFTAVAEAAYEISEKMDVQTDIFKRIETSIGGLTPRLDAMQTAIATSNIHLADISKYTKNLIAISDTLEEIRDNTKHL